jgi:hypothetical protein
MRLLLSGNVRNDSHVTNDESLTVPSWGHSFFAMGIILSIVLFAMGPLQDRLLLWSGLGAAG